MLLFSSLPIWWFLLAAIVGIPLVLLVSDIVKWCRLPPGPLPIPFRGNKIPTTKPWIHFQELSKKYGPIFTIWIGRTPTLVISDPEVAVDLMEKRSSKYSSRPRSVMLREVYGTRSLLLQPYGKAWSSRRKLFHRGLTPTAISTYKARQEAEATRTAFRILETPLSWERALDTFAAALVFSIAYGRRIDTLEASVITERFKFLRVLATLNVPGRYKAESFPILRHVPNFLAPWKKEIEEAGKAEAAANMALVDGVKMDIQSKWEKGDEAAPSLTKMLLDIRENEGIPMSDVDFAYISAGVFGAGADTTSATLCSAIFAFVTHPAALKTAQVEMDAVIGSGRTPTFDDEKNLPYMSALVKEVLRWRPVAVMGGTPHATTEGDVYRGWYIPAGTGVMSNLWAISLNEEYYPNPNLFDPARYLEETDPRYVPELEGKTHPGKGGLSAFGWGRRRCVAADLAMNSLFIALSKLIWAFDILPITTYSIFNYTEGGSNIRPKPFECLIRPRSEQHKTVLQREKKMADLEMEKFPAFI
ncbi:hypothetical protein G7Y89_g7566 [Cudoniella acicularis]|uniref:Cytochrome P450 n=1 Tax=Cudoniella acicularis TaxID=354080 RepID=A0A8H4RLT8_9HELO|nr:hypothetical protein G7Y89_g7566 [Cudoniella acicularis]